MFHKWGPMPAFVYAPAYAGPMAYWLATGGVGKVSDDYPYGLVRPHEQMGTLIVIARLVGMVAGLAGTIVLGWGLLHLTGSRWSTFLALFFCVATSPEVAFKFVATKPDGLMLAFLAASMGVYARIIAGGLTRGRGVALSVLAVASISCKELTAPVYVLPYVGLAFSGLIATRGDGAARRRFLGAFAWTIAAGLLAYALLNVVYAPSIWRARMDEWLHGAGKDPAVWAAPGYTTADYLLDAGRALLINFDGGGLAILAASALATIALPVRHRLLLWLPTVGFVAVVLATAGYMPAYFLVPANMTAALPVASAFAALGRASWPKPARAVGLGLVAVLAAYNAWGGNAAWAVAQTRYSSVLERFCVESVDRGRERIFLGNMIVRQPGFDRLSYLGFEVDDRPLGALLARPEPERMPDLILVDREHVLWLEDFADRPKRVEMMKQDTGYDYAGFKGYESLGYRLDRVVKPELPPALPSALYPWYRPPEHADLLVYRRVDGAGR